MKDMKASDGFKKTIENYLRVRANTDEQFRERFEDKKKSIDECINFIFNTVKASGCNGFDDEEIYGMAVHYYDEDNIPASYLKKVRGNVVVNQRAELTAKEKAELEKKAKEEYYQECLKKQREQMKPKARKIAEVEQPSLFG